MSKRYPELDGKKRKNIAEADRTLVFCGLSSNAVTSVNSVAHCTGPLFPASSKSRSTYKINAKQVSILVDACTFLGSAEPTFMCISRANR